MLYTSTDPTDSHTARGSSVMITELRNAHQPQDLILATSPPRPAHRARFWHADCPASVKTWAPRPAN